MKRSFLLFNFLLILGISAFAQKPEIYSADGVAIKGYDAISYFNKETPVKGVKEFSYNWKGADWYFADLKNLELFKSDPLKYAPQYGGYCAYGLSRGYKAPTDPEASTIINGKLYLNYNKEVRVEWKKNQENNIRVADSNWVKLR
jgi:YHS domain-containing protein